MTFLHFSAALKAALEKAFKIAQEEGAEEIKIEHLLKAFEK